jgi:hypothetical protein
VGGDWSPCGGALDESVSNACGACGAVPAEVCNGSDDDGDGDEGLLNACGDCGTARDEAAAN